MSEPPGAFRFPTSLVDDELVAAAPDEAVESGWWSMGPRVAEFEEPSPSSAACVMRSPSRTAPQRSTWRCSPSAAGRETRYRCPR